LGSALQLDSKLQFQLLTVCVAVNGVAQRCASERTNTASPNPALTLTSDDRVNDVLAWKRSSVQSRLPRVS
jgi:hypothetical protein